MAITNRNLHEEAAGMALAPEYFSSIGLEPDAAVVCNCQWDSGHEAHCDIVAAHELLKRLESK